MVHLGRFLTDPRRAWMRLGILMAFSALCFAGATFSWLQSHTWLAQAIYPLDNPLANLNQVGVNVALARYEPDERERALARIEGAGLRWVRQRFPWNEMEPQRGVFDWATWDAIVAACASHDLGLIAVLDGSPLWARPDGPSDNPRTPPQEVADWGAFVARFAERYRGQIAAYQLWDEPNLTDHWGDRYVDPVAYTALLREGAIRVRDADSGAVVLFAALAPTVENGPLNLNEVAFLKRVLDAGGRPFFDVVALQPYGFDHPPGVKGGLADLNFDRAAAVRREMVRMGLEDCPVWGTAWGWNALPADWGGRASLWPTVSQEQQVTYTPGALEMARREWPWMGPMILYAYQPDVPADDARWGFAMVDMQDNFLPIYDKIREYHATSLPLHTGVYLPDPDNARYRGEWRFSDAGADPPHGADADARNATVEFDFIGTSLDVTVRRGDFWGVFYVVVDGRPANRLPRDEMGGAYLVLHDPLGQVETVTVAQGLSAVQTHHVEIVAQGGWGQWPLAGWTVRQDQAVRPGMGAAGWLFLLGGGAALAVVAQLALMPPLLRSVYAFVGRVFRRYRALPEWVAVLATLGTALAFYFAPWTFVSLPLLGLLLVLFFLRIDLGLATVAFALPFYLKPKFLGGRPVSIVELGVWLCALAWLVARALDRGRSAMRDQAQPLYWRLQQVALGLQNLPYRLWHGWTALGPGGSADIGMAALVLVAALSLNWATYRSVAVHEFRTVFVESALFYALIRLAVRSVRARQRLLEGWLLGAAVISLVGIGQMMTGQNLITAEGVWRVRGLYGSPNNLALYLERALPVLLAFAWQGRDRTRRLVYGVVAFSVFAALVLTFSKGALMVGLPVSLLALGMLQRSRRAIWITLATLVLLASLLIPFASTDRFRTLFSLNVGTGFFRLKLWRSSLSMIADHPMTGVGLDNFLYFYRTRYVLPSAWGELDLSHPHNLLLDAWTRLGVGGVVVLVWLLVSFFRITWGQLRGASGDRRAWLLGLMAAMAGVLAHGMVDHAVFLTDLAFVFALLMAMAHRVP
jgi:O-antigen ligase